MATIEHRILIVTTEDSNALDKFLEWREELTDEQKILFTTHYHFEYFTITLCYHRIIGDEQYEVLRKEFLAFIIEFVLNSEYGCKFVELSYGELGTKILNSEGC